MDNYPLLPTRTLRHYLPALLLPPHSYTTGCLTLPVFCLPVAAYVYRAANTTYRAAPHHLPAPTHACYAARFPRLPYHTLHLHLRFTRSVTARARRLTRGSRHAVRAPALPPCRFGWFGWDRAGYARAYARHTTSGWVAVTNTYLPAATLYAFRFTHAARVAVAARIRRSTFAANCG